MDFGRDVAINTVNFKLPNSHGSAVKVLGGNRSSSISVYVGGVLWSDENFVGTIYPAKAKPKDYAKHYTKQFNTIELNTTHYRLPEKERIIKWQTDAPEGFKFAPKVPQAISHSGNLVSMVTFANEFNDLLTHFGTKRGTAFLQLPPHFAPNRLNELLDFLDSTHLRPLAIEVRHADWFKNDVALNALSNYLYKNKMPLVITDTAGRRDVCHARLTHRSTLIRFNANDKHPSDFERLDEWAQRLNDWFNQGLETAYFFVHTPQQINMPNLVTYFMTQLKKIGGIHLSPPKITSQEEGTLF